MSDFVVEMVNIEKSFPGIKALNGANLQLKAGEVMALLGENGAGKSTLMKILGGVHHRDAGTLKIMGQEHSDLTPKTSQELGIAMIHQELNMCADLTVAENIFLAREKIKGGVMLSKKEMRAEAQAVLDELNVDISADDVVGSLSISKQQMVEIAKALNQKARVLIMDEPTSALSSSEIDELFKIVKRLRDNGCAIVYISHRLAELKHIVNRVTIMRDGKFILCKPLDELSMDEIIKNMVGRELTEQFPRVSCELGETIFEVKNLNAGPLVRNISLSLRKGEIVGIAGLMGAGRTELTRAIFGADPHSSGTIELNGKKLDIKNSLDAIKSGVVLAPEDRRKDGLCTKLTVRENLSLPNLDRISNMGVISRAKENEMVQHAIKSLSVKLAGPEVLAGSLSGGNQQKIVVGKWLETNSKVVIFDEPTRGIDVAAKVEIYNIMNELKQEGIGVLFVSSEMPEVLGIADRIIVMCDGRITGELDREDATQEKILEMATQFEDKYSTAV